ncbi:MAG TPA: chemotaxis protein CheB, partial [Sphingomonas sp.]|uniref:chemotaxis protein CheB n=1 Tax=Sphingomonas sp. TaxID=28214 RepID=UPI002ED965FA
MPGQGETGHDIVVVGGSAGSLSVLKTLLGALPAGLPASVFIVTHLPTGMRSTIPELLDRLSPLPVAAAHDGEAIVPGRVYVAPPGSHMLIVDGHVRLGFGPRENLSRPAIDPLFRSAAIAHGRRVVGVVLTGMLDDGSAGLAAIRRCGGLAVVQDPVDA